MDESSGVKYYIMHAITWQAQFESELSHIASEEYCIHDQRKVTSSQSRFYDQSD